MAWKCAEKMELTVYNRNPFLFFLYIKNDYWKTEYHAAEIPTTPYKFQFLLIINFHDSLLHQLKPQKLERV